MLRNLWNACLSAGLLPESVAQLQYVISTLPTGRLEKWSDGIDYYFHYSNITPIGDPAQDE
ncbi:MAG TPA: hypothetical protein VMV36_02710 [Ignavibacteriaceae bacterium]|nr:hypothetical protein [Ignavibacteriaceae bacterium]